MRAGFAAELSCSACRAWKPLDGWRLRVEVESNSETSGLVTPGTSSSKGPAVVAAAAAADRGTSRCQGAERMPAQDDLLPGTACSKWSPDDDSAIPATASTRAVVTPALCGHVKDADGGQPHIVHAPSFRAVTFAPGPHGNAPARPCRVRTRPPDHLTRSERWERPDPGGAAGPGWSGSAPFVLSAMRTPGGDEPRRQDAGSHRTGRRCSTVELPRTSRCRDTNNDLPTEASTASGFLVAHSVAARGRPRGERSETLVTGGRSLGETFHRLRFQSDPEGPVETKGRGRGDGGGTDGVGVAEEETQGEEGKVEVVEEESEKKPAHNRSFFGDGGFDQRQ
ncbi:unnamed protein product [Arctogadus glacialis]